MKEKSLGYQLAHFAFPTVAMLGLSLSACQRPAPEQYIETPNIKTSTPVPITLTETPVTTPIPIDKPAFTKTPTAAGGEITRPEQIPPEVWNQLTNEQRQAAAKEIQDKTVAERSRLEREAREEKAQQQAQQAAEEAARAAEYQFNQEINKNKTSISAPSDILTPGPIFTTGSTTPLQAAEGFVQAAAQWDLNAARGFFAPDKRPASWETIFPIAGGIDLSQCTGVPHQSVERAIGAYRLVNIIFSQGCVHPWGPVNENSAIGYYYIPKEHNVLSLPLEQANGRWYIAPYFAVDRFPYVIHRALQ